MAEVCLEVVWIFRPPIQAVVENDFGRFAKLDIFLDSGK